MSMMVPLQQAVMAPSLTHNYNSDILTFKKKKVNIPSMIKEVLYTAKYHYPGVSPRAVKKKFVFLYKAALYKKCLGFYYRRMVALSKYRSIALRPNMLGFLEWPNICNTWSIEKRFDVVATHYELMDTTYSPLNYFVLDEPLIIADLSFIADGVRLLIDRPPWFVREGQLVLNLFDRDLRVVSLAFTLGKDHDGLMIMVGAIQGIHNGIPKDDSLLIFKQMTKLFDGLRPRSLLLEVLRIIARILGANKILAVADENRHHRHPYFSKHQEVKFRTNYNEIWKEHGGIQNISREFYVLPIVSARKAESEISSKKRAMYRRRYQKLDTIETLIRRYTC